MAFPEPVEDGQRRRLPLWILVRVFFRSFLIQIGFNPRTMQGLGFLYALYPALKWLYPAGQPRLAAVRRHLRLFNTHPYFAAAILGGTVRYEERIASGLAEPEDALRFRDSLSAPLAGIGDAFFWNALRPACALLAALMAPRLGLWAIAVFLVLYDVVHLSVRVWLYKLGYTRAQGLVLDLGRVHFPLGTLLLRRAVAVMAGALAAELAVFAYRTGGRVSFMLVAVSAAVVAVLAGRLSPFLLVYAALAIALLAGLFS